MRLIDADALMEKVCGNCQGHDCVPDAMDTVYGCELAEIINQMPTIEPEVRHGRWQEIGGYEPENQGFACSVCDFATTDKSRFCPNCGARMDGGADNG